MHYFYLIPDSVDFTSDSTWFQSYSHWCDLELWQNLGSMSVWWLNYMVIWVECTCVDSSYIMQSMVHVIQICTVMHGNTCSGYMNVFIVTKLHSFSHNSSVKHARTVMELCSLGIFYHNYNLLYSASLVAENVDKLDE